MVEGNIHSIESFGTVDGPGVRLVVFTQGCPLRCLYCHNPDSWEVGKGNKMSVDDILKEYDRNRQFYRNGGITVTGGEPLMQIEFVTELFEEAKKREIHTCLDTSGGTFNIKKIEQYDRLMAVCDLVLLDLKNVDPLMHYALTYFPLEPIKEFVEYLANKNVPIWIRHVYIDQLFSSDEMLKDMGHLIGHYRNIKAIDVLPYHSMGKMKYTELNIKYKLDHVLDATDEDAKRARAIIIEGIKEARKIEKELTNT